MTKMDAYLDSPHQVRGRLCWSIMPMEIGAGMTPGFAIGQAEGDTRYYFSLHQPPHHRITPSLQIPLPDIPVPESLFVEE